MSRLEAEAALAAVLVVFCHGVGTGAQLEEFTPVSKEELRAPDPSDWLHWRRTADAWGYSPLDEITSDNVENLQLSWERALETGQSQPTPLVHNGRMYLTNPGNVIQRRSRQQRESSCGNTDASCPRSWTVFLPCFGASPSSGTRFSWIPATLTWSPSTRRPAS